MKRQHETILILDFGSQYTQLITRKIRENNVHSIIVPPQIPCVEIRKIAPRGIVLSGGPNSIYDEGSPRCDESLFKLGIPVLAICYGLQLMADVLNGEVRGDPRREYGRAELHLQGESSLLSDLSAHQIVWMSHGDRVVTLPPGFKVLGSTPTCQFALIEDQERRFFGLQFHPEVHHTPKGRIMLRNFLFDICGCHGDWTPKNLVEEAVADIQNVTGEAGILCALSGGVDSTVTAVLCHRAVGNRLHCILVDNGVLREGEAEEMMALYRRATPLQVKMVDASERFLARLKGVEDPEEKRKRIGREFIAVFEEEAKRLTNIRFLAQGTLYPDLIESKPTVGPSAIIKSHHNVGGLPEVMGLDLIEPLNMLFKDEVRRIGAELSVPQAVLKRHPFPGPGLAVRVIGEVTPERLLILKKADRILLEEIEKAGMMDEISQCFAVLLPVKSVGIMGDGRTYENVIALRAVRTEDFMTAEWVRLDGDLLGRISSRIVNEVQGVNRVLYDISTKPPSTVEWE